MLILTRRIGECLVLTGDIEIEVLHINGNQCRLGIRAPRSVQIDRKEIWLKKLAEVAPVLSAPQAD